MVKVQSLGTLLNKLFNTKFEVMNAQHGRSQTTKGIMFSWDKERKFLIYDVEGIDSRERRDNKTFENCTSLFALACTDLLIINMWTFDIGRYTASNLGILSTIFKLYLKLFVVKFVKQICFIFRDYEDNQSINNIITMMQSDIFTIWNEIPKPEKYKNSKPNEFFCFNFFFFHNMIYKLDQFQDDLNNFKSCFNINNREKYIFRNYNYQENIPIDGYSKFISSLWIQIREQKELNLPCHKELVSQYKCKEHKNETLEKLEPKIRKLENVVEQKFYPMFVKDCTSILEEGLLSFRDLSSSYEEGIVNQVKLELIKSLYDRLFRIFVIQMNQLCKESINKLRNLIKEITDACDKDKQENFWINYGNYTDKMYMDINNFYQNGLNASFIKNSNWEYQSHLKQFKENLGDEFKTLAEKEYDKFTSYLKKTFKIKFLQFCKEEILNFECNMYSKIEAKYTEVILEIRKLVLLIFSKGFSMSENQGKERIKLFFKEYYNQGLSEIKKVSEDLNSISLKKFIQLFNREDNGLKRKFSKMKEEELNLIYEKIKINICNNINLFKVFPIYSIEGTSFLEDIKKIDIDFSNQRKIFEPFLSPKSLSSIQEKFIQQSEEELDRAKNGSLSVLGNLKQIPPLFWVLILVLSYDKILWIISNPFSLMFLIPIIFIFIILEYFGLSRIAFNYAKYKSKEILIGHFKK